MESRRHENAASIQNFILVHEKKNTKSSSGIVITREKARHHEISVLRTISFFFIIYHDDARYHLAFKLLLLLNKTNMQRPTGQTFDTIHSRLSLSRIYALVRVIEVDKSPLSRLFWSESCPAPPQHIAIEPSSRALPSTPPGFISFDDFFFLQVDGSVRVSF